MTRFNRRSLLSTGIAAPLLLYSQRSLAQEHDDRVLPESLGPSIPPELLAPSGNWPVAQGDLSAMRNAVGSTIDTTTVDRLEVLWEFAIEAKTGYGGMTATPIVIDDRVYVQDMLSNIFVLERKSGQVIWERNFGIPSIGPNGVSVAYGMVFATLGDTAEVIALEARTGVERWRVQLSNNPGEGIDMAPAVYDSTVYVSTVPGRTESFNRGGTRGVLFALEAASGATIWQFDTTTNNLWGNPRVNSGGGIWYPPSFDDNGGIYFGTGNAAPWPGTADFPNGASRPAPNDYASSMVALDRATGGMRWHYNAAEHDLLDHDFQNSPLLIEIETRNGKVALAIGSGKTGSVVAVDRSTGALIWRTLVGRHENDELEFVPEEAIEIYPGAWGGVLTPLAADHSRIFVPVVNMSTNYSASEYDRVGMFDFTRATGEFIALDQMTGSVIWSTETPSPPLGGVTVVNDLVVTSTLDGLIRIFDAETGAPLKSFPCAAGINANPAVAGNLIIIPAAAARIPSEDAPIQERSSQSAVVCLGIFDNM